MISSRAGCRWKLWASPDGNVARTRRSSLAPTSSGLDIHSTWHQGKSPCRTSAPLMNRCMRRLEFQLEQSDLQGEGFLNVGEEQMWRLFEKLQILHGLLGCEAPGHAGGQGCQSGIGEHLLAQTQRLQPDIPPPPL